jgi:hypothetical protein
MVAACRGGPETPADTGMPARVVVVADARPDASVFDAALPPDAAVPSVEIVEAYDALDGVRCVLTVTGEVVKWPWAPKKKEAHVVNGLRDVTRIACNRAMTCGESQDGTWSCVGDRPFTSPFPSGKTFKVPLSGIDTVVPYLDGLCAVGHDSLYCWGDLGGRVAVGAAPTRIELREVVKFVDSGNGWSLIRTRGGDVYCWGRNYEGVCGPGRWYAFVAPRRIATGIVDVAADSQAAWLLRRDGVVLGSGHVSFESRLRKEHVPTEPEGDDFFYSDVPIPVTLPGRAKQLLGVDCVALESGEAGCAYDRWYPRPIEELKPCRAEDGVVKCGEKVVALSW